MSRDKTHFSRPSPPASERLATARNTIVNAIKRRVSEADYVND